MRTLLGKPTAGLIKKIGDVDWLGFLRGIYEFNLLRYIRVLPPRQVVLNVTYRCNARCQMCRIWEMPRRIEMTLKQFVAAMEDPLLQGVEQLDLSGGEPFLRQDLIELSGAIIERLPNLRKLVIVTNGLLPRQSLSFITAIAPVCRARGIRMTISISVDGLEALNDQIRGVPGSFAKASETLRLLRNLASELGFVLTMASVLCKKTLPYVSEYQAWSRSLNVDSGFQLIGFHETYVSNLAAKDELDFSDSECRALYSLMEELSSRRSVMNFASYYWNDMLHLYREKRPRRSPCSFAVDTLILDALGDVYYCLSEPKIGNWLSSRSLSDLYRDKKNLALRKKRRQTRCPSCNSACLVSAALKKDAKRYLWFLLTGLT